MLRAIAMIALAPASIASVTSARDSPVPAGLAGRPGSHLQASEAHARPVAPRPSAS
jgi:hypothetical protein